MTPEFVLQKLNAIEVRLKTIEAKLDLTSQVEEAAEAPSDQNEGASTPAPKVYAYQERRPLKKKQSFQGSSNLLAVTAVICFVLASAFTIKLAVSSGWLTPFRQFGLSMVLGIVLCLIGRFFDKIDSAYRSYLSAAGCIILYLTSYAGALFFETTTPFVSMLLTFAASGVTLSLFNYHRSDIFAFVASVGTYICPLIFTQQLDGPMTLAFYFIAWSAVFSFVAIELESRTLSLLSCYMGLGIYSALCQVSRQSELLEIFGVLGTLGTQFIFFAGGVLKYSIINQSPLSKKEVWLFFPLVCFFYAITFNYVSMLGYHFEPNIGSFLATRIAPIYGLLFAGSLYALYSKAEAQLQEIDALSSKAMVQAFLCVALFHSGYLTLLPHAAKTWLLPASLLMYYVAHQKDLKIQFSVKLLLASLAFFEWISMVGELLLEGGKDWNQIISGLSVLTLGGFYYSRAGAAENVDSRKNLFLWGLHILAISLSFRLVSDFGSLAVTGAWGVYAMAVLGVGYQKRDIGLSKSSTLILLAVAAKALLYDASHAASGVRIVCLLLTGLVLYGAGYLFKKISQWESAGS